MTTSNTGQTATTSTPPPEPLIFHIPQKDEQKTDNEANKQKESSLEIKLHQMDESQGQTDDSDNHNTGFVMWPAAVMLSRYIAQNPPLALGACGGGDVLELGAGCGLVGLTAAAMMQERDAKTSSNGEEDDDEKTVETTGTPNDKVIFTDYNADVLENLTRNAELNKLEEYTAVAGLDFFDQEQDQDENLPPFWIDMQGNQREQVCLILGADIICYSNDAELVANSIMAALKAGGHAIIIGANANRRFGVEDFPAACENLGLDCQVTQSINAMCADNNEYTSYSSSNNAGSAGDTTGGGGDDTNTEDAAKLLHDLDSKTSGYNNDVQRGYDFTMFTIQKPITSTPTLAVAVSAS